jgi:hypothetical protein
MPDDKMCRLWELMELVRFCMLSTWKGAGSAHDQWQRSPEGGTA